MTPPDLRLAGFIRLSLLVMRAVWHTVGPRIIRRGRSLQRSRGPWYKNFYNRYPGDGAGRFFVGGLRGPGIPSGSTAMASARFENRFEEARGLPRPGFS